MNSFFKNILYILYKYYNKGETKSIAYECALSGLLIILYINLMTILAFLKIDLKIDFYNNLPKILKYVFYLFISIPFYFVLKVLFPKQQLLSFKSVINYKLGISLFFSHVVISLILLIIAFKMRIDF